MVFNDIVTVKNNKIIPTIFSFQNISKFHFYCYRNSRNPNQKELTEQNFDQKTLSNKASASEHSKNWRYVVRYQFRNPLKMYFIQSVSHSSCSCVRQKNFHRSNNCNWTRILFPFFLVQISHFYRVELLFPSTCVLIIFSPVTFLGSYFHFIEIFFQNWKIRGK